MSGFSSDHRQIIWFRNLFLLSIFLSGACLLQASIDARKDFDLLADAVAIEDTKVVASFSLTKPKFGSVPHIGVEIRPPGAIRFSAPHDGLEIPDGSMVRFFRRTMDEKPATTARILLPPDGAPLDFHPGTVFHIRAGQLDPRLGRFRLVLPTGKIMKILVSTGLFAHIASGEVLFEIDAEGNGVFALIRGSGWVKDTQRKTVKLMAGKQIGFSATGILEKPRDIDSRWKQTAYQGFAPYPNLSRPKDQPVVPESVKQALASLESGKESGDDVEEGEAAFSAPAMIGTSEISGHGSIHEGVQTITSPSTKSDLATASEIVPAAPSLKQQLPDVSNSLLSFMSPSAKALMEGKKAGFDTPAAHTVERSQEVIVTSRPASGVPSQNKPSEFSFPTKIPFQLPGSLSPSTAKDLLKNLQDGVLPLPSITWKYIFLPGFSPVPIPVPVLLLPGLIR